MSELRFDPIGGEWVIIAEDRGHRPHAPAPSHPGNKLPSYQKECPFCPWNEAMTPPPTLVIPALTTDERWLIRVFPNKYGALTPESTKAPNSQGPLFRAVSGYGIHEVIVETPDHSCFPAVRRVEEMTILVHAYQLRYRALENIPAIQYISIFKNHGTGAGTSLLHPHSQIIASSVVPENVLRRVQRAEQHYGETAKCLCCHIVDEELRSGSRVVYRDEHFLVFHPFASARPAETWIVPFTHQSSIGQVNKKGLNLFGAVLGRTLKQLSIGFGDPDFNYAIHSVAGSNEEKPYLHWYLQLVPRLTMSAGFELGSGIQINSKSPESTAAIMRQAIV